MSHYLSIQRIQLFFNTSNQCAAFLVLLVFIFIGISIYFFRNFNLSKTSKILYLLFFFLSVLCEYLIVLTYSRGGYIAFILTAIIFFFFFKKETGKKQIFFFLVIFLLLIIILPKGISRILSMTEPDKSIYNRLILWKGATAITFDYWLTGTGFDVFGNIYSDWYQPINMNTTYSTAINNYLTISAGGGIILLFIYLIIILSTIWILSIEGIKSQNSIILGVVSAQVSYCISCLSNTFIYVLWINIFLSILIIFSIIYSIRKWIIRKVNFIQILVYLIWPLIMSLLICLMVFFSGWYFKSQGNLNHSILRFKDKTIPKSIFITPAKINSKALILYSYNNKVLRVDNLRICRESKDTIRYLVEKGYSVIVPELTEMDIIGLGELKRLAKSILEDERFKELPLILFGQSEGGQYSIIAASEIDNQRLKRVITIGSPADWPFDELSPRKHIKDIKVHLLIIHGEEDKEYNVLNAFEIEKYCKKYNISSKLYIVKNVGSYLGEKREETLDYIDKYLGDIAK